MNSNPNSTEDPEAISSAVGLCDHIRIFLNRNKVFFETVAAVLLSVMAIIISILQYKTTAKQTVFIAKQTALIRIQTDIANMQADLTKEQVRQQGKQTALIQIQTDTAKMQADLTREQVRQQGKEAAITRARDWAMLRESLRPILERYPALGTVEIPALRNLSREEKVKWLSEMESLVSRLGTNPVLIDSRHNYERYLAMLGDLALAKTELLTSTANDLEAGGIFYQVTVRIGEHARRMWWDLGMFRSSRSPRDKIYQPTSPEESIFQKGFPWEDEIRRKDAVQPIAPAGADKPHH